MTSPTARATRRVALIVFDDKSGQSLLMKSFVQQELIKRGILWSGFHNMCYSHTEADLDYTLAAYMAKSWPFFKERIAGR